MNRSHQRFVPPVDETGDEHDAFSPEALERTRKVRRAIEAGLRFHRDGDGNANLPRRTIARRRERRNEEEKFQPPGP